MGTNKIFAVKQIVQNNGKVIYKVFGYASKFNKFLNSPNSEYTKENKSFEEALDQIDTIQQHIAKQVRTVYTVRFKLSGNDKFEKVKTKEKVS